MHMNQIFAAFFSARKKKSTILVEYANFNGAFYLFQQCQGLF